MAPREPAKLGDDCLVLLDDATKLFCRAVSEGLGERRGHRWSASLPVLLYEHPEKCDEILSLVEQKGCQGLPALDFSVA